MPGNPSAHRRFEGLRAAHESAGNHLRCSCPDGGRLFVLTGSSNIFSTGHVADSLAGRMPTLTLWPLTVAETMSRGPSMVLDWAVSKEPDLKELPPAEPATRADYIDRVLKGGFPEVRDLDHGRRQRVYGGPAWGVDLRRSPPRDQERKAPLRGRRRRRGTP